MSENKQEDMVEGFNSPINLHYQYTAGKAISAFLRSMKEGKIVGQRSDGTGKIIVPPRGSCPETGKPTQHEVELPETATVIMFTVVHLPIPNSDLEPPFIVANLCFDESDQTFIHLIKTENNADVVIGTRVKAVWKPKSEWDYSFENIKYFELLDEPPVDIEALRDKRVAMSEAYKKKSQGGS